MKIALLLLICVATCYSQSTSCVGRCGDNDGNPSSCQCNAVCGDFGDCCPDYSTVCFTCEDRCNDPYVDSAPCHCNDQCNDFSNCCSDYNSLCDGGTPGGGLPAGFYEEIFTLDAPYRKIPPLNPNVEADGTIFLNHDPAFLQGATYDEFLALRDTYSRDTCTVENEDIAARDTFLDACFATPLFQYAVTNLSDALGGQNLRDIINVAFFGFYDRCDTSTVPGSNGFEHVFYGEIDGGSASGYHNWVSLYMDEFNGVGTINSMLIADLILLPNEVYLHMVNMDWYGANKPITSFWSGTSPCYELMMYTAAFEFYPGQLTPVTSNGVAYNIQTYTQQTTMVGSAYPDNPFYFDSE